jgi:hypothetical protein
MPCGGGIYLEQRWGVVPLHEVGRKVHCRRGEIPDTDGGQTAPRPGQCQRHCGVLQGFNTLFILLPICRKSGCRRVAREAGHGRPAASGVAARQQLCCVYWKGDRQHSMSEKMAQEIVLKEVQKNLKIDRVI